MLETDTAPANPELVSPAERDRLVRLCARLSGSAQVAEDLAQETLLEAWKARDRLSDPAARAQWLSGIARNICRRWHAQASSRVWPAAFSLTLEDIEIYLADDTVLDIALEQSEVANLVDRALCLLPAGARELLVERYVEDLPVGEIAARRRLSEGTAAVRLHRGRRALRRILDSDLRDEAIALGLLDQGAAEWQATRIWCSVCGGAHLEAQRDVAAGTFAVRCPACRHLTTERGAGYLGEVKGYWRTLLRVNQEADRYYRSALGSGSASCACCGRAAPLRYSIPRAISGLDRDVSGVHVRCEGCGGISMQPDLGLALTHPTVLQFWRRHKRVRLAGRQEMTSAGQDAILVRFQSVTTATAVEVISAANTFEVLQVCSVGA